MLKVSDLTKVIPVLNPDMPVRVMSTCVDNGRIYGGFHNISKVALMDIENEDGKKETLLALEIDIQNSTGHFVKTTEPKNPETLSKAEAMEAILAFESRIIAQEAEDERFPEPVILGREEPENGEEENAG